MARRKKDYEDDDGRTIVPMDQIPTRPFLGMNWVPPQTQKNKKLAPEQERKNTENDDVSMTSEERRMYVLGALKGVLLIALAYLAGMGLIVLLLTLVWR